MKLLYNGSDDNSRLLDVRNWLMLEDITKLRANAPKNLQHPIESVIIEITEISLKIAPQIWDVGEIKKWKFEHFSTSNSWVTPNCLTCKPLIYRPGF